MNISDFILLLETVSKDNFFKEAFQKFCEAVVKEIKKKKVKVGKKVIDVKLDRKDTLGIIGQSIGRYKVSPEGFLKFAIKYTDTTKIGLEKLAEDIKEIIEAELKSIYEEFKEEQEQDRSYDNFVIEFASDFKEYMEQDKDIYKEYPGLADKFEKAIQVFFSKQVGIKQRKSGKDFEKKVVAYLGDILGIKGGIGEPRVNRFPDGQILSGANKGVLGTSKRSVFAEDKVWFEVKEGRQTARIISPGTLEALYKKLGGGLTFDGKSEKFWEDFAKKLNTKKRESLALLGLSYTSPVTALYFINRIDGRKTAVRKTKPSLWRKPNNIFYSIKLALNYGTVLARTTTSIFGLVSIGKDYSPKYGASLNSEYLDKAYSILPTNIIEDNY